MTDNQKRTPQEQAAHMNALATRIGDVLEGETTGDSIMALAACIAWGLKRMPDKERIKMRSLMDHFIDANSNMKPAVNG
jgi:hypothetical protein